jgi:hypothetical protein
MEAVRKKEKKKENKTETSYQRPLVSPLIKKEVVDVQRPQEKNNVIEKKDIPVVPAPLEDIKTDEVVNTKNKHLKVENESKMLNEKENVEIIKQTNSVIDIQSQNATNNEIKLTYENLVSGLSAFQQKTSENNMLKERTDEQNIRLGLLNTYFLLLIDV